MRPPFSSIDFSTWFKKVYLMCKRFVSLFLLVAFVTASSGEVTTISAIINAAQEVPTPSGVSDSAAGFATLQYDDVSKELSWDIAWQDLTGSPVGMHFHADAAPGATAGVALDIGGISGLSSPSVGSSVIADDFAMSLLDGLSYINIHTGANGPGEIRGQVNPSNVNLFATLDTAQEIPSPMGVPADAGGSAAIAYDPDTNLLGWNIEWANLTGPAVAMHFHGPAGPGSTAPPVVDVGAISGLMSPSIGAVVISDDQEAGLLGGQWYLNVHTAANGPGEIRGQVVPEPGAGLMILTALGGLLAVRRRHR